MSSGYLNKPRDLNESEARERLAQLYDQEAESLATLASYGGCYVHYYGRARELRARAASLRKGITQ